MGVGTLVQRKTARAGRFAFRHGGRLRCSLQGTALPLALALAPLAPPTCGQRTVHTLGTLIHNLPRPQRIVPHLQQRRKAGRWAGRVQAGSRLSCLHSQPPAEVGGPSTAWRLTPHLAIAHVCREGRGSEPGTSKHLVSKGVGPAADHPLRLLHTHQRHTCVCGQAHRRPMRLEHAPATRRQLLQRIQRGRVGLLHSVELVMEPNAARCVGAGVRSSLLGNSTAGLELQARLDCCHRPLETALTCSLPARP